MPRFVVYEIPLRDFTVSEVREVYRVTTDFLSGFVVKDVEEVYKILSMNLVNFYILEIDDILKVLDTGVEQFIVSDFNYQKERDVHPYYYLELPFWSVNYGIVFDWLGVVFDHNYGVADIPPREFIFQEVA